MSATGIAMGLNKGHIVEKISEDKHKALSKGGFRKVVRNVVKCIQLVVSVLPCAYCGCHLMTVFHNFIIFVYRTRLLPSR